MSNSLQETTNDVQSIPFTRNRGKWHKKKSTHTHRGKINTAVSTRKINQWYIILIRGNHCLIVMETLKKKKRCETKCGFS